MVTKKRALAADPPSQLSAADMTHASDLLIEQAAALTLLIKTADDDQAPLLLEKHRELIASARDLNDKAIDLLAGDTRVSGDQIIAAIAKAGQSLERTNEVGQALALAQKVLALAAAVLTGNAVTIVTAIGKLAA